jgi:hypothetical protein
MDARAEVAKGKLKALNAEDINASGTEPLLPRSNRSFSRAAVFRRITLN